MTLNDGKCYFINFSRKRNQDKTHNYINNCILQEVSSFTDQGITIDSSLNFKNHYDNLINRASKLTGFRAREMKIFREPNLTIIIYNSYIRSILEKCCIARSPFYQVHGDRIERIQKRFVYNSCYLENECQWQIMTIPNKEWSLFVFLTFAVIWSTR